MDKRPFCLDDIFRETSPSFFFYSGAISLAAAGLVIWTLILSHALRLLLVLVFFGCVLLVFAVWSAIRRDGLLNYIPESAREYILNKYAFFFRSRVFVAFLLIDLF